MIGTFDKTVSISSMDNSLLVDDLKMANIDTLKPKGSKEPHPELANITSYSSTQDFNIVLWPCGNSDLSVVDVNKMEYDVITGFFSGNDLGYLPISLKSSLNGRKVMGLSMLKISKDYILTYWHKVAQEDQLVTMRSIKMLDSSRKQFFMQCKKLISWRLAATAILL